MSGSASVGARAPGRRLIAGVVVTSVIDAVLTVLIPVGAGFVLQAVLTRQPSSTVALYAVLSVLPFAGKAFCGLINQHLGAVLGEGRVVAARLAAFNRLQRTSLAYFQRPSSGRRGSRVLVDTEMLRQFWTAEFAVVVTNTAAVTIGFGAVAVISWPVAVVALLTVPLYLYPVRLLGRRAEANLTALAERRSGLDSYLAEKFSPAGVTVTKVFGRAADEARAYRVQVEGLRVIGLRTVHSVQLVMLLLSLTPALVQGLVYAVGGWLTLQGAITPGALVTLAMLLTQFYGQLSPLMATPAALAAVRSTKASMAELEQLPPDPAGLDDGAPLPAGPLDVRFDRVVASHDVSDGTLGAGAEPGAAVLKELTFHLPAGWTAALVGPSGAGKTTAAGLLMRLYEYSGGSITIGGVDLRRLDRPTLARELCLVPQDATLFDATLAENLRYGRPDATDTELWDVLAEVGLEALVRSWAGGLGTAVGSDGQRLSGGERQRVAIARAMLADPRVIVLDEATAHLDQRSERQVQNALTKLLTGRTALVIAHRLSTVRNADVILVLDDGRIAEAGTHEQLLRRRHLYAELAADD